MFPRGDRVFVPQIFGWAIDCFTGLHRDYQAIDALYHDFEHTLQGTLCMARLLEGRHLAGAEPVLSERLAQLGLVAILLHDTGYLKKRDDRTGTGAKYTVTHVRRSAEFASEFLGEKGFAATEIKAVQNMILCTGVDAALDEIPFQNELERTTGYALATADLLGQMAAEDYIDKLAVLYAEFAEAARHDAAGAKMLGTFSSAEDLMQKTPAFWENCVRAKLDGEFGGLYRFLEDSKGEGRNCYVERVEENIGRLRRELARA
jgi:predicted metal-dependent HD superfamily phosphohydrolase